MAVKNTGMEMPTMLTAIDSQKVTDANKRTMMLKKVEQILHDEAAFVPLHWQDRAWAARKGVDIAPIVNVMNFPYLGDLVIR